MKALLAAAVIMLFVTPVSAGDPPRGFMLHETPKELPDVSFQNGDGQALSLSAFRGKTLLVNVWATWCPPCRHEMPTLDRLQGKLGGPAFEVVALSIDRSGPEKVRTFFAEIDVKSLALYIDTSGQAARELQVIGLPVTILIDPQGRELGRLTGPAEWDTPEMIEFFKGIIAGQSGGLDSGTPRGFAQLPAHASRSRKIRLTAATEEQTQ